MSGDSQSGRQEQFRARRDAFEAEFEQFLVSPQTPVEARRQEAQETVERLIATRLRLRDQGVL